MALDSSILLNTQQQPGIMDAISSGFQSAEAIRNAPLMRQLMAQRFQQGQGAIQAQQFNQQQAQAQAGRENATQEGLYINRLAKTLREAPQSMRAGIIAQSSEAIRAFGADPSKVPLDDQSLDNAIAATNQFNLPDPSLGLESRRLDIREQELDQRRYLAENEADRKGDIKRSQLEAEADLADDVNKSKVRGSEQEKRLQGFVAAGVDSANALPTVNRTLELLEFIDTGGIDAASLRIKQFFGVEGADEGELSANLGKAVLSQLRSTFGAQFTEREGARLERIEAGFGKSLATNKRLIKNLKTILEREARRGLKAAKDVGDEFSINEINEAMAFKLTDESAPKQQGQQSTANQTQQPKRLRFNPQTGRLE